MVLIADPIGHGTGEWSPAAPDTGQRLEISQRRHTDGQTADKKAWSQATSRTHSFYRAATFRVAPRLRTARFGGMLRVMSRSLVPDAVERYLALEIARETPLQRRLREETSHLPDAGMQI